MNETTTPQPKRVRWGIMTAFALGALTAFAIGMWWIRNYLG